MFVDRNKLRDLIWEVGLNVCRRIQSVVSGSGKLLWTKLRGEMTCACHSSDRTQCCSRSRCWQCRAGLPRKIGIGVSIRIAPPALPVYEQPICPGDGFMWTPGYWGYADGDYFWVPGTWVRAPFVGGLWTPGYWGWGGGLYAWHAGYWGRHIGFYGGVNYGIRLRRRGICWRRGWRGGVFAYKPIRVPTSMLRPSTTRITRRSRITIRL